jgi:FAD/FMN-containing dehydrogenase
MPTAEEIAVGSHHSHYRGTRDVQFLGIESYRDREATNWAKNVSFRPEYTIFPKSKADLVAIVASAREHGKRISVIGKGHSWNPLMAGDDYLVCTVHLSRIWVDVANELVTVEAGATIRDVDFELAKHGLCVPYNIVGTTDITYGGIVATGSHGSGHDFQTMSDYVESIEMVLPSGKTEVFSTATHGARVMNLVRLNLGMLGFMYKMTFRAQRMFNVRVHDRHVAMERLFDELPRLLAERESVEVLWFPYTDRPLTKSWERTSEKPPGAARKWAKEVAASIRQELVYQSFHKIVAPVMERRPAATPFLLRTFSPLVFPDATYVTDVSSAIHYINDATRYPINETEVAFRAIHSINDATRYPINETDVAFPYTIRDLTMVRKAWFAVVEKVAEYRRRGRYPLNIVAHMRFIGGSSAALSPSRGNEHTCYMDFGNFHSTPGWKEWSLDVWREWRTIPGVRLHWAKDMAIYDDLDVRAMYGVEHVERFLELRRELDPGGMFSNRFVSRLFGLSDGPRDHDSARTRADIGQA